uniref:Uncharacterized protein n=1 Tax=Anguilla anguilla TaxID=7936 RepID=A0A0E9X017_ANGAN
MWYVSNKNPHIKDNMQTPRATSMHIMFKNKVFMGGKNLKVGIMGALQNHNIILTLVAQHQCIDLL